ncbi:hypothetical protein ELY33_17040 [Vreelandella andesensis]|uniref:Uncharacterized protein n=1 Tax=Vreelandella andesensis TaxID=447567 RepID=A0A3S0Y0B0_9GAMM|nr:hypothetical protein [Halomonas andesensis]RUR26813.1 hypothetical protein ELY33_17040 [Halomonas andesensis]
MRCTVLCGDAEYTGGHPNRMPTAETSPCLALPLRAIPCRAPPNPAMLSHRITLSMKALHAVSALAKPGLTKPHPGIPNQAA